MPTSNTSITLQGKPITVKGEPVQLGGVFPAFRLTGNDMQDISNDVLSGKIGVISVVPSLDTPVCSISTRKFNNEVPTISPDVIVLTVSRDLPFAQKRWCGAEGVGNVITASDYKYRSFGEATGTLWSEAELLARAVFITDRQGKVCYVDYVPEIAQEPNYEEVIAAVRAVA